MSERFDLSTWRDEAPARRAQRRERERAQMVQRYDEIMREVRQSSAYFTCTHERTWTLDTEPEDLDGLAIDSIRVKKCQRCKKLLEVCL